MVYKYTFSEINEVLYDMELGFDAAELHGMICGFLCYRKASDKSWKELIFDKHPTPPECIGLFEESSRLISDDEYQFDLFLLNDDEKLSIQAEALASWCKGLVTMLGLLRVDYKNDKAIAEVLNDMIEITKLDYDELSDTNRNEEMLAELHEYVKTAVLLLHTENKAKKVMH